MIKVENEKLQNELKSLRIQCKRQEKVLKNYEDNQSSLPQGMEIILRKFHTCAQISGYLEFLFPQNSATKI